MVLIVCLNGGQQEKNSSEVRLDALKIENNGLEGCGRVGTPLKKPTKHYCAIQPIVALNSSSPDTLSRSLTTTVVTL